MNAKKTIYLIRHGETEYNRLGMVQGSGIDSPLNARGKKQAALFYKHYGHVPFDHVYTSALKRTRQSVSLFLKKKLPHTALPGLNEISWGKYEGYQSNPGWKADYQETIQAWKNGRLEESIPGGETPLQLQARQKEALEHILRQPHTGPILICMHGRAMKSFLCLLLGLPLTEMEAFSHENLSLYLLEQQAGVFSLLRYNDLSHLREDGA